MTELEGFIIRPCKSKLAFEFIPKRQASLDLGRTAEQMKKAGVFVEIETPFILILQFNAHKISFYKSGKMIIKDTASKEEAEKIALGLLKKIDA
jgi:TATA-box binding protein (TBP) (component of TFIID and TFIIIB)